MLNDLYTENLDVVQKAAFIIYGIVGIMWIMNAIRDAMEPLCEDFGKLLRTLSFL